MKSSDRRILLILGAVVAVGALWFGLISPKRAQLGDLDGEVAAKQAAVTEQEQIATAAQTAKDTYRDDYRRLITLGKAVPAGDDSSSLIDQIQGLADDSGVEFLGLELSAGAGGDAAPPADASGTNAAAGGDGAASGDSASGDASATTTAAPATETAAADLPLGATVGAAGLPIMPYALTFRGSFFDVADFLAGIDGMVRTGARGVTVDGRLLTVDGFDLHPDESGSGRLAVSLEVTSYVAPADQGVAGGATPATPAPGAAVPATSPATSAGATPAATAAVTP